MGFEMGRKNLELQYVLKKGHYIDMTVEYRKAQLSQTNVQFSLKTLHHYLKLSVRTSAALITFWESFFALTPLTSDTAKERMRAYISH